MSMSLSVILKKFAVIFAVVAVLLAISLLFSYDVIKVQWVSFMGLQPSYEPMESPLPVPTQSIPIEGPAYIANLGAPKNPVPADQTSLAWSGTFPNQLLCVSWIGMKRGWNGRNVPAKQTC